MSDAMIQAAMNYAGDGDPVPVEVGIRNGRAEPPGCWQDCGFELQQHQSAVTDWEDTGQIERLHYSEISALAKKLTGCDHALVGSHISRNPDQARNVHEQLSPITFVHSDFAPSYRDVILNRYRTPEAAQGLAKAGLTAEDVAAAKRILVLQFWRNTGPARMDFPIAFCDARSVGEDELAVIDVVDYAGAGVNFQTLGIKIPANPASHAWYTYPDMSADEVAVFRTFDSAMIDQHAPFWTPHSAFRDPDVEVGKPSRRSIELRATCLFMDE